MDFCLIFKILLSSALISGMAVALLGPSYLTGHSFVLRVLFNLAGILFFVIAAVMFLMIIWIPETRTIFA
ncbi:hypothetical protein CMETHOX_33490 [Lacrimispora indolis]|nr:hypothetical protein CMETHOX_33490 [[Clostridium] methoxybenzovorans]